MCLSDSPVLNTGFSTISMNILNKLADLGYESTYLGQAIPHAQPFALISPEKILKSWGVNPTPEILKQFPEKVPSVYLQDGTAFKFNLVGQALEPYCKDILQPFIKTVQPDIHFTLLDTFMVYPWYNDIDFSPAKTIFYYPSDGEPFLPGGVCDSVLRKMSVSVAMSKHGQRQVKEYHKMDTEYIPHACDHNLFSPMTDEEKHQLRIKWGLVDKYVVGCVARNQPRKMMDRAIKAFAKFARDKEDVVFLLHMDPQDRAAAFDINKLVLELGIQNKVLYTGVRYFQGFPYEFMREIYNLFDVFLLLTSGEGFGVPIIEAMSCEIPVVVTDYTTSYELIEEDGTCGELVKLSGIEQYPRFHKDNMMNTLTGSWNVERGIADTYDGCMKLNKLYYDRNLGKIYGKAGRKKVLKNYTWDVVIPQWDKLMRKMVNE